MDENAGEVVVVVTDDGLLMFGSSHAFPANGQRIAGHGASQFKPLSPAMIAKAGKVLAGLEEFRAQSGRWVKLDAESARFLRSNGVKDVVSGVVRAKDVPGMANGGQIVKHLNFKAGGLLTPAAPAALAAIATQAALESALGEIRGYLEEMDLKLDRLLKQRKVESLGQIGGVKLALDEAEAVYRSTGVVSRVTWSKVQGNALALKAMQAEALAQLSSMAEDITERVGDTDKLSRMLADARKEVAFWLGMLARTLELEERQYLLELARVGDEGPDELAAHRAGIRIARADRERLIVNRLTAIDDAVRSSADLENFNRMLNPIDSKKITESANGVSLRIKEFAAHFDAGSDSAGFLEHVPWRRAAKAVVGDAAMKIGEVGPGMVDQVRATRDRFHGRREKAPIKKKDKKIGDGAANRRKKSIGAPVLDPGVAD